MCVCRPGRQAWMAGAPLLAGGPKLAPTTAGPSWPGRGGAQYTASAGGVLQRNSAPGVATSGPSTTAFGSHQQPPPLAAASAGLATAAGLTKPSAGASGSGSVPTKCPFSNTAMSSNAQHSTGPADFNSHIKYAISSFRSNSYLFRPSSWRPFHTPRFILTF